MHHARFGILLPEDVVDQCLLNILYVPYIVRIGVVQQLCQPEHVVRAACLAGIGREVLVHRAVRKEMFLVGEDAGSHDVMTDHLVKEMFCHL